MSVSDTTQPLQVLLVDDNPHDRALALRELQLEFHAIDATEITDAAGLRSALDRGGFQLVITDYRLQWTDGVAVLGEVKSRYPDCPVIMVTGSGNEEIAVEAMKAGLDDYIVKSPRHYARLRPAARAALQTAADRQARRDMTERYRKLFEGVPVGLYRSTPEGRILDANRAMLDMLRADRKALLACKIEDLYVNPDDRRRWVERMERNGVVREFDAQVRRLDGELIWIREHSHVVKDGQAGSVHYEGAIEDITEPLRRDHIVRQTQKMEAIGQLASGIAHDFNNLLTALFGYAGLAKDLLSADHPARDPLDRVEDVARQAGQITRSLLTFARNTPDSESTFCVKEAVAEATRMLKRMLPPSIEFISRDGVDAEAHLHGDSSQLQQVLFNLAINARDAMPDGGRLEIETSVVDGCADSLPAATENEPNAPDVSLGSNATPLVDNNERRLCLTVTDTGIGMSRDVLAHLYEPFFTTKPRGQGTGLGLSIVHGVVRGMGGGISVKSRAGRGTRFTVMLPLAEKAPARLMPDGTDAVQRGNGELILLAEDHEYVRAITATSLQAAGYAIEHAADGEKFLELYRGKERRARLVILDAGLPRVGGRACVKHMRECGDLTPAIIVTGSTPLDGDQREDAHTVVLRKPYPFSTLARLVGAMLTDGASQRPGVPA